MTIKCILSCGITIPSYTSVQWRLLLSAGVGTHPGEWVLVMLQIATFCSGHDYSIQCIHHTQDVSTRGQFLSRSCSNTGNRHGNEFTLPPTMDNLAQMSDNQV